VEALSSSPGSTKEEKKKKKKKRNNTVLYGSYLEQPAAKQALIKTFVPSY
jgi:hypothetical protein